MTTFRGVFVSGFLTCLSMLSIAGYFQFVEQLEPCPLCILQRVMTFAVGVIFLLGALHNPRFFGKKVYGFMVLLLAVIGAAISARHVWIQNLPADQVPSCGPGLNFILENFPINKAVDMILRGSGECAEVVWTFWGLSIPGWTFVAFAILGLMGLSQLMAKTRNANFF